MSSLLNIATQAYQGDAAPPAYPKFQPGDTVCVHVKIKEGSKERTQRFEGVVLQIKGDSDVNRTFTVRKVSGGVGIERIFPFRTPTIDKIELIRYGKVRRARLFYLRNKQGKAAKVKEDIKRKFASKAK